MHLVFIAAVALIVLGPKRLPELAKALGKGVREFRDAMSEGEDSAAPSGQAVPTPGTEMVPAAGTAIVPAEQAQATVAPHEGSANGHQQS